MTQIKLKDILYHMIAWLAIKAEGKEEELCTLMVVVFTFLSNH